MSGMLTNADCTIYTGIPSSGEKKWTRQYVPKCWWFLETKSSITTEGLKTADILKVRIPDMAVVVKKGDVILKGKHEAEIETVKDLKEAEYFTVIKANYNEFGDSPHIRVEAV